MSFEELFRRLNNAPQGTLNFNHTGLQHYPPDLIKALIQHKIISKIAPAIDLVCPGCEKACCQYVHVIPDSDQAFILCDERDDIYSIPVPLVLLDQWQLSRYSLYNTLADASGISKSDLEALPLVWQQAISIVNGQLSVNTDYLLRLYFYRNPDDFSLNRMVLEGDNWTIIFKGIKKSINNHKGIRYIEHLVRNKGKSIHFMELYDTINPRSLSQTNSILSNTSDDRLAEEGLNRGDLNNTRDFILDRKSISDVTSRMEWLKMQIVDLVELGDLETMELHANELAILEEQISKDKGLINKPRQFNTESEKIRKSVQKSIKDALGNLKKSFPELAEHFKRYLVNSTECQYTPHHDVIWRFF